MSLPARAAFGLVSALVLGAAACTAPAAAPAAPPPTPVPSPLASTSPSPAASPAVLLEGAAGELDKAIVAAQGGDLDKARKEFEEFHADWGRIEDGIRARSRDAYRAIEDAMDEVEAALVKSSAPNRDQVVATLQKLRQVIDQQKPALS